MEFAAETTGAIDVWQSVTIGILATFTVIILIVVFRRRNKPAGNAPSAGDNLIAVPAEIRYASLLERFLAVFIDGMILLPLSIPALILSNRDSDNANLAAVLATIVEVAYYVYFEYKSGQTPGKRMMKIKVIRDGGSLTLNSICIRNIYRFAGLLMLVDAAYLTLFWMLTAAVSIVVSKKKQRPLDMLARTVVIKVS